MHHGRPTPSGPRRANFFDMYGEELITVSLGRGCAGLPASERWIFVGMHLYARRLSDHEINKPKINRSDDRIKG